MSQDYKGDPDARLAQGFVRRRVADISRVVEPRGRVAALSDQAEGSFPILHPRRRAGTYAGQNVPLWFGFRRPAGGKIVGFCPPQAPPEARSAVGGDFLRSWFYVFGLPL